MSKKNQIIAAAQALFARFGLKKVTTDDIAEEAGVSKATIYRFYRNKAEILDDVVKLEADQLLTAITEAVDDERTVAGKFRAHLLTKLTKITDLINFYKVTQDSGDKHWPYIHRARIEFMKEEQRLVRSMIDYGNKKKEIFVRKPDLVARMMVVSLHSQELTLVTEDLGMKLDEYVNMMVDIMINGIRRR